MSAHSKIGPSSAERWWNCPGSVALTANMPNPSNEYAAQGVLAHSLAEGFVEGRITTLQLYERIGEVVKVEGFDIEITEEMVAAVEEYRDLIAARLAEVTGMGRPAPVVSKSEVRLSGEHINPALFGTADHLIYQKGNVLDVFDLKYGKREVEAGTVEQPNKQLATYAVMAMDSVAGWAFEKVRLHIFQPRARNPDDVHCWVETTPQVLKQYREELVFRARETEKPNAPLVAGEWCHKNWCLARADCKTRHKANVGFAQVDFAVIPATPSAATALPSIDSMPIAQLAVALGWEDTFDSYFKAAKERATRELEQGKVVPGYKLVPGRSNRAWRDEAEVVAKFSAVVDVYEPQKVKSPAALEKLVGKKAGVDDLTFKPEAPLRLAKDSDARSAETPGTAAAKAFDVLPHQASKDQGPLTTACHAGVSLEEELGLAPAKVKEPLWPV